jgi:hypothetical protein
MRKVFMSVAAAGALAFAAVTASQAQVMPPVFPRTAPPPAMAPVPPPASVGTSAIPTMRRLLAGRGFDADVVGGPMMELPPGQATAEDFGRDGELDTLLPIGVQPAAWLVATDAGRWWLWETGAAAPADARAETYQAHVLRRARAEGRFVGD